MILVNAILVPNLTSLSSYKISLAFFLHIPIVFFVLPDFLSQPDTPMIYYLFNFYTSICIFVYLRALYSLPLVSLLGSISHCFKYRKFMVYFNVVTSHYSFLRVVTSFFIFIFPYQLQNLSKLLHKTTLCYFYWDNVDYVIKMGIINSFVMFIPAIQKNKKNF